MKNFFSNKCSDFPDILELVMTEICEISLCRRLDNGHQRFALFYRRIIQ